MHEGQLVRRLIAAMEQTVRERNAIRVHSAKVRLGGAHFVDPEAFKTLFELMAKGTVGDGVKLTVEEAPPRAKCSQCGETFIPIDHHPSCPSCGSLDLGVKAEPDLQVLELTLEL